MKNLLLILATILMASPRLWAQTQSVSYIDANGHNQTADATEITNETSTLEAGWHVVLGNDVQTGTLTCNGEVHLILADDAKLTATGTEYYPGIQVSGIGNSLTIYAQNDQSGQLIATGGQFAAGIGGNNINDVQRDCSPITINGGTITANAGLYGAGIGGGYYGSGSNITINGGMVTADGGYHGACIGGGCYGNGTYITINDGTVIAKGKKGGTAAGIGGGQHGYGSNITINGGMVTASGAYILNDEDGLLYADGIGSGRDSDASSSNIFVATALTVKAGESENPTTVIAPGHASTTDLAGSLAGKQYVDIGPDPQTVRVTYIDEQGVEKSVYAKKITGASNPVTWGEGWYVVIDRDVQLGQGAVCNNDVRLILGDDCKLTAIGIFDTYHEISTPCIQVSGDGNSLTIYGQTYQTGRLEAFAPTSYHSEKYKVAAIGGGDGCSNSNITINGGTITATGGRFSAAIGGGAYASGSNITINGGTVNATGGQYGAGIGGGSYASGSNITINGGTVNATGGMFAAAIGGGNSASGSNITINGGIVTANGDSADGIGSGRLGSASSNIIVNTTLVVRAGDNENPTNVIENAGSDLAGSLAGKRCVKIAHLHSITVSSAPENAGTVTATMGGEPVESAFGGNEITVLATPADCYTFVNWTENGEVVSTDDPYTFILTSDRNLVANFTLTDQYDFTAICETGQKLYYKIIDEEKHWVMMVAPNGDNEHGWDGIGITKPEGDITLPETVTHAGTSYTVTAIGNYAFNRCYGLTGSLTIPNSVKSIGNKAFEYCSNFTGSLTIGNSVTSIGNDAFYQCTNFTGSLTIGSSVESIGSWAFAECSGFNGTLTIPNSVKSIADHAFYYCSGFNGSLTIPNFVTIIGGEAFRDCLGFTGSLAIPNSVTIIGDNAFRDCSGFNGTLTIGNSLESIGLGVFHGCSGFTGSLIIPNSVTLIETGAFYDCSGFTGPLTIPNSVKTIGNSAFENCSGFTGPLTIPDSVEEIGDEAFKGCSGLTGSLTIGSSMGNSYWGIGKYVFDGCNFTNIISKSQTAPTLGSKIPDATGKVYIPRNTTSSYQSKWAGHDYTFIEYDREDYHFNGTGNEWNTAANWEEGELPAQNSPLVFINADCQVNTNAEVGAIIVAAGKTLTVNAEITLKPDGIILENGAQLINNGTVACNDLAVMKDITGYGTSTGNWYLVSSPVATTSLPVGMATTHYDLYRFSQAGDSQGCEWLNYKAESFGIESLSGYLYANKNNTTILFLGGFADTGEKELEYVANAEFPGFNLVGNPYPCNAYLADSRSFYRMNTAGTELIADVADAEIAPCEGVFVQAQGTGESVTFTTSAPSTTRNLPTATVALTLSQGRSAAAIDRAIVRLGEGDVLGKLMLNADGTRLYIPQNGKDYAVVSTDATRGEMPLNFKAAKNGSYSITVNVENADLNYLHLVDNLTGNDVDLLGSEGDVARNVSTYTFNAKTDDYASRFKLVFGVNGDAASAGSAGNFAYISNGEIIVSNEGRATLQVIDVMGRIVSSEEINGECRISTNGLTAGVYVLNLNGMTQKIVVK